MNISVSVCVMCTRAGSSEGRSQAVRREERIGAKTPSNRPPFHSWRNKHILHVYWRCHSVHSKPLNVSIWVFKWVWMTLFVAVRALMFGYIRITVDLVVEKSLNRCWFFKNICVGTFSQCCIQESFMNKMTKIKCSSASAILRLTEDIELLYLRRAQERTCNSV